MSTLAEAVCAQTGVLEAVLADLQERIGPQKYNAWFKHGAQLSIENGHVKVLVPNPFVANWIETHYRRQIAEAARGQTGQDREVVVMIDPTLSGRLRKGQLDMQAEIVAKATTGRARPRGPVEPTELRHRLEEFVVGKSNKLAYSAALALAGGQGSAFNPLFIYGSCGVGKTHLLQGICRELSKRNGNGRAGRWRYVTAEQFTNEYISAVRKRNYAEFRGRYRKLGLLAIDDVHFLSAKKATQEEFLHTFNAIQTAGNQIVMASDAHPRLLGDLIEQLVNRFVAGIVVKIDAPDRATRLEILRRRARKMKLQVPRAVLEYIAAHIKGSVRELEGALIKLAAMSALEGGKVKIELAREALADHLARTDSAITLGDIEAVGGAFFGITPADLHSTRRTRTVSVARMVTMFLARRHTRMSFPEIGRFMGKNHSSVVLAVKKMESLLAAGGTLTWMTPLGTRSVRAKEVVELLQEQFA
ncbi:MAG: chromosomal replication initiator protein DnaA [Phycisphaerae bacterium]|nr:chromosomal replication initiator protein DnaA [Phycisphaerae bacterium]